MKKIPYLLLCAFHLWACSSTRSINSSVIRIKGSDTMIVLAGLWAEEYMQRHPGISIYVDGGGTAVGIEALIKGEIEICTASRPLRPSEVQRLVKRYNNLGIAFLVARDALSIYLHPDNPVRNLSLEQVKGIFTGSITNWQTVGGKNESILVFSRSPNSGTFLYFQEHVLHGEPYGKNVVPMPTTAAIVEIVTQQPRAIGYGGIAYGASLVHCPINGVSPTEENVRKEMYPIARYLYFYTIDKPRGTVKAFIDWVLSKAGQKVVKKIGYIPLFEISASSSFLDSEGDASNTAAKLKAFSSGRF
ncbi:MAG: phosphate ABC transporter substrate-binding protein [candidate division KSB1 bacterium]|nr:phosphate ABC transporter substrate-binding protein [candidate division KSB1 bacterium]